MTDEPLLSDVAVAEWLDVPVTKVVSEAKAGRLPHVTIGRRRRYTRAQVESYIAAQSTLAADPLARSTRSRRRTS